MNASPDVTELLLVGGGHAHVSVLRRFAMQPLPGLRITLISAELHTPYSGMLPGVIAGDYAVDDAHIDLWHLAVAAGARLLDGSVAALDADLQQLTLADGRVLDYDWLSINCGGVPGSENLTGDVSRIVPVKPIGQFLPAWRRLERELRHVHDQEADHREPPAQRHLAIVGGGAGGVELALAVAARLQKVRAAREDCDENANNAATKPPVTVTLVSSSDRLLPGMARRAGTLAEQALVAAGIDLRLGFSVRHIAADSLHSANDEVIRADDVLWVTGVVAPDFVQQSDLSTEPAGHFIRVDEHLRSESHSTVFAAGDVASLSYAPRPKAGVFAVRAGAVLADNLRAAVSGKTLRKFRPQSRYLVLIGTSDGEAIAARGALALRHRWFWPLKQWIDQRFIARFSDLPEMAEMSERTIRKSARSALQLPESEQHRGMRCGGCGSKLGAPLLDRVLQRLRLEGTGPLVQNPVADDAAALPALTRARAISVDGFRAFISDPFCFGQLACVHALGDVYAMGAKPEALLAHATVPFATRSLMERDLYQLLCGVSDVLQEAGGQLIGGHSTEGDELALSLTAIGITQDTVHTRDQLQPGMALLATQPLGTGVLFAAAMNGAGKARWFQEAITHMRQLPAAAAEILLRHDAAAMTDITGFGLMGHLSEMVSASGWQVAVDAEGISALAGARSLFERGFASSLQRINTAAFDGVVGDVDATSRALLADPQTCGGLLACVPEDVAGQALADLRAAGYDAWKVGSVLEEAARNEQWAVFTP